MRLPSVGGMTNGDTRGELQVIREAHPRGFGARIRAFFGAILDSMFSGGTEPSAEPPRYLGELDRSQFETDESGNLLWRLSTVLPTGGYVVLLKVDPRVAYDVSRHMSCAAAMAMRPREKATGEAASL